MSNQKPDYEPTPAQIRSETAAIRVTWDEREHWRRMRADMRPDGWTPPGTRESVELEQLVDVDA